MTTFGAGLLIGTALIVIIPEGVEALYSEGKEEEEEEEGGEGRGGEGGEPGREEEMEE